MKTNRGLLKYIVFGALTFGIYDLVVITKVGMELNQIAKDGRHTMNFCLIFFIFSWLTLGIAPLVWFHRISDRIGCELRRRGLMYDFGAGTWWGWGFFGALIVVGPYIYIHKLLKASNMLNADYNVKG